MSSIVADVASAAQAEGCAGQEQHREGQRVRVDRPLELRERRVQILADHRQRRRHDEVVERHHEEGDRGDRKRPADVSFVSHHYLRSEKERAL
jgi:hypothetical protein